METIRVFATKNPVVYSTATKQQQEELDKSAAEVNKNSAASHPIVYTDKPIKEVENITSSTKPVVSIQEEPKDAEEKSIKMKKIEHPILGTVIISGLLVTLGYVVYSKFIK